MDLEVVGRHALLFDDDSAAAFVNSRDALVEWNSLFIDRYDVRHLLFSPPPPRKFARRDSAAQTGGALELEIEHERFLDLPLPPCEDEDPEVGGKADGRGFRAVAFVYRNGDENNEQKVSDADTGFRPSFSLPESMLQNLPTTDKLHQIIARTALFVREYGGQSEIVLRVKQGDNPTFGFLMPDHQLHPYFRFLMDHPDVLNSDHNGKSSEVDNGVESGPASAGGALSLLGANYGSGEDEDVQVGIKLESDECKSNATVGDSVSGGLGSGEPLEVASVNVKQILACHSSSSKDKATTIKKNRSSVTVKSGGKIANKRKGGVSVADTAGGNSKSSGVVGMKVEQRIVEPPSDVKRLIDKIVEFIAKNGKEFEAVLVEQDKNYERFSFLLPSSHYHPYYLAALHKAEKSKLTGRKSSPEKDNLMFNGDEKKESSPPVGSDIPYESDRKGKFKMFIGRTKKDGREQPSKEHQQLGVSVDVDAAAAILQAVRKGIKNPTLDIFQKASQECGSCGTSHEDRESASVSSNKVNSKAAADSEETHLTREEKLKAERLRRAKMFTALLKSGAAPVKTQLSHGSSLETSNSEVSGVSAVASFPILYGEGGSDAINVSAPENVRELDSKVSVDEQVERRSRRRYRSRAETREEESDCEDEEDEVGDKFKEMDNKHLNKKRSHRSSHHSRERHKHRKGHSLPKDGKSHCRHRHKSSEDELRDSGRQRHESSSADDYHSRSCQRKHRGSPDDEHRKYRRLSYRRKHDNSSDDYNGRDGHGHRKHDNSSDDDNRRDGHGHRKHRNHEERDHVESDTRKWKSHRSGEEMEEGEIKKARDNTGIARVMSADFTASFLGQPSDATGDDNDFRAKIRAMLMSTM